MLRHIRLLGCATACALVAAAAGAQTDAMLRERILAHGPWPPPFAADPSNRVSGRPQAVAFGERLFFSARLSANASLLCASCHETWRYLSDGRARGRGIGESGRNTPSLFDLRGKPWYGWDGANDSLWAQSIRPLLDPREMGGSAARIAKLVREDDVLGAAYTRAFDAAPPDDDAAVLADIGKALAAYQETLVSPASTFDRYRDALARVDTDAARDYPAAARRGLELFVGKAGCATCHAGPSFSDNRFHRSTIESRLASGEPDQGRADAIGKLLTNPYRLRGYFDDAVVRADEANAGAERVTLNAFRTPSLRGVALTAPYMHDGSRASLCEAVQAHTQAGAPALPLSSGETADLASFLRTLSPAPMPISLAEDKTSCR